MQLGRAFLYWLYVFVGVSLVGAQEQKQSAARYAAELVQDDMVVGLGTGTTAEIALQVLAQRYRSGLRFVGVPTSNHVAEQAHSLGIPTSTLEDQPLLDLDIDGADEIDGRLNLIKGHGGALLKEKIVASAADRFVVVADQSKRVSELGGTAPVPVEVIRFGWASTKRRLEEVGLSAELRGGKDPYLTDAGNYILDCRALEGLALDARLAQEIKLQTGVVEHGLFLAMADMAVIGKDDGEVDLLLPADG